MNALPKHVCSRTVHEAERNNTTVLQGDAASRLRELKRSSGADLVILGSGELVASPAPAGLIDEYRLALIPEVLGRHGKPLFGTSSTAWSFASPSRGASATARCCTATGRGTVPETLMHACM